MQHINVVYFLVGMQVTSDTKISSVEMREHLIRSAQPDEEQGFVKIEAWELTDSRFEWRKGKALHADSRMPMSMRSKSETISLSATIKS